MSLPVAPITANTLRRAVLPAAGLGTRLRPLTQAFPKELLPVGRKPVLAHIATELLGAGITEALFVVSERKPQIRGFFGDLYEDDVTGTVLHCSYVIQEEQRGLGDALLCAAEWTEGEPFVVAFGDCLIEASESSAPLRRLLETHRNRGSDATVLTEQVAREKVSRYGVLAPAETQPDVPTEPFALADIVEKPAPEDAPSRNVVAARWILAPAIFEILRRTPLDSRGELNLTDAVRTLKQEGGSLWAAPLRFGEFRRDIGNFETFYAAFIRAALNDPEFGSSARRVAEEALKANS
ncbi:MAG: UDP-glucose pyrophosphorylase [Chthonomonadaceae bacterium]|nr:UDP-glucose pyrophosphorylase [Chthonomonadaceae bacterium]